MRYTRRRDKPRDWLRKSSEVWRKEAFTVCWRWHKQGPNYALVLSLRSINVRCTALRLSFHTKAEGKWKTNENYICFLYPDNF